MDLIIILIAISFLVIIFAKPFFNKLNIPLSFSAMFIGMVLGTLPLFQETANTDTFSWFANLGMLFMIFSIIFQMKGSKHKQDKALGKYLIKAGIKVITLELLIIFPLVYFFLEKNILSALLISLIFTTVAEVMVIPFLKKFKIINTKLGKSIVGIGILDNAFEYIVILIASFSSVGGDANIKTLTIAAVATITAFILVRSFSKTKYLEHIVKNLDSNGLFLLSIGALFLFSGILSLIGLEFLGAVIAAILIKNIVKELPKNHNDELNKIINASSEGLFGPIFFLWVGVTTNLMYIVQKPGLAIIFVLVGLFAKIIPTVIATAKDMNIHSSIILGIALKFGSGIIFIKLLFEKGMITELTYTLTVAAILLYRILIPLLLGHFITKWKKDLV
ncbi:MAG: cation:proton antiporter [Nanoarchaeota archaeon]|nr:cation:proton antiporter [Nanoarchaeota archaeon]